MLVSLPEGNTGTTVDGRNPANHLTSLKPPFELKWDFYFATKLPQKGWEVTQKGSEN